MSNDSLKETFFAECEELVESLTEDLETVASGDWDMETINAIFRAVHSIKGAAGAFGFADLVDFAHHYETVLDLIRSDKMSISPDILRLITRASDALAKLVDCSRVDGSPVPAGVPELTKELTAAAGTDTAVPDAAPADDTGFDFAPLAIPLELDLPEEVTTYQIVFRPEAVLYANGHEPLQLFHALSKLGDLEVVIDQSALPDLAAMDFDEAYLSWALTLHTSQSETTVADVFGFVEGLCDLEITPIASTEAVLPEDDSSPAPDAQAEAPAVTPPAPQPDSGNVTPLVQPATAPKPAASPNGAAPVKKNQTTLRVDPERVDRLINSVGELIINQAVISQNLKDIGLPPNSDVTSALDDYEALARDIQEAVMAIRAQPVKSLFQRMGRVVREAGEATGKPVTFISEGETTEIDKTMLERLADPLTHMLRNAVDHGVEDPESRAAAGKDPLGRVSLSAAHRSGHVVIEISDDGAGINRERLLAKAIEKGIVTPDAKLTESEIDALLFAPGFSTAENVTNLSGRGVGMDVVKTAITSLGGKVGIASQEGKGSKFSISLPLTLAVLDGMIVEVGTDTMVIPLSNIVETVRPLKDDICEAGPGETVLKVRGTYVPVVDCAALLGMRPDMPEEINGTFVLIDVDGSDVGFYVDAIHDQRQVVIKSLEGNYGAVVGIAAATILGDGKIALIMDPEALLQLSNSQSQRRPVAQMRAVP